jgi:hypothetical protein
MKSVLAGMSRTALAHQQRQAIISATFEKYVWRRLVAALCHMPLVNERIAHLQVMLCSPSYSTTSPRKDQDQPRTSLNANLGFVFSSLHRCFLLQSANPRAQLQLRHRVSPSRPQPFNLIPCTSNLPIIRDKFEIVANPRYT